MKPHFLGITLIMIVLLAACQTGGVGTRPPTSSAGADAGHVNPETSRIDRTHLPIGGQKSTAPTIGAIWQCNLPIGGGGAHQDGPWISSEGTYDLTAKAIVDGEVSWPYVFKITVEGDKRILVGNALPSHSTGAYPIASTDDAYQYDRNPNHISAHDLNIELPAIPAIAVQPSCLPGEIGVLLSGSALFNPLDALHRDAVAYEAQDSCQGHPQRTGLYHYHSLTSCLTDTHEGSAHSPLMGYAFDGFGIYGHHGENGAALTNADLDACHGHTHRIEWDGIGIDMYHYHATWEYPYVLGCFRGRPVPMHLGGMPPGNQGPRPDLAAAAAKLGISEAQLRAALGPPPPNLAAAASRLGISEQDLRRALSVP